MKHQIVAWQTPNGELHDENPEGFADWIPLIKEVDVISRMSKLSEIDVRYRGAAIDTLVALVERGPLDDGDVPSKTGRNILVELGLASKIIIKGRDGYQAATYEGREAYCEHFGGSDYISEATAFRKAGNVIASAKYRE